MKFKFRCDCDWHTSFEIASVCVLEKWSPAIEAMVKKIETIQSTTHYDKFWLLSLWSFTQERGTVVVVVIPTRLSPSAPVTPIAPFPLKASRMNGFAVFASPIDLRLIKISNSRHRPRSVNIRTEQHGTPPQQQPANRNGRPICCAEPRAEECGHHVFV